MTPVMRLKMTGRRIQLQSYSSIVTHYTVVACCWYVIPFSPGSASALPPFGVSPLPGAVSAPPPASALPPPASSSPASSGSPSRPAGSETESVGADWYKRILNRVRTPPSARLYCDRTATTAWCRPKFVRRLSTRLQWKNCNCPRHSSFVFQFSFFLQTDRGLGQ